MWIYRIRQETVFGGHFSLTSPCPNKITFVLFNSYSKFFTGYLKFSWDFPNFGDQQPSGLWDLSNLFFSGHLTAPLVALELKLPNAPFPQCLKASSDFGTIKTINWITRSTLSLVYPKWNRSQNTREMFYRYSPLNPDSLRVVFILRVSMDPYANKLWVFKRCTLILLLPSYKFHSILGYVFSILRFYTRLALTRI